MLAFAGVGQIAHHGNAQLCDIVTGPIGEACQTLAHSVVPCGTSGVPLSKSVSRTCRSS